MKVVLDTNILISALMRNSTTRRLIVELDELILSKSSLSEEEFNSVSNDAIQDTVEEAKKVMLPIDEKDVIFLATAMALEDAVIRSDDKHFKQQNKAKVKTTQEMLKDFQ
ncbi:MAG: hypothetical protein D6733_03390 [Methanobacteriota archaeon]|nr:MAG: hypothetical protein D6733_03390 [Euryarchaeota archaeon]